MAKALTAGSRARQGSIEEAFGQGADALRTARERLASARADVDRARESGGAAERLATDLAELVGELRVVISSAPPHAPTPASAVGVGADCSSHLEAIRTCLEESGRDVRRLAEQALRFRRIRALADRLRSLLPGSVGQEGPVSVESTRSALDRAASRIHADLDDVDALVGDLRRLESATESAKMLLADMKDEWLAPRDGKTAQMCEVADRRLAEVDADVERGGEAVDTLACHAAGYRDDIRLVGSIMSAKAPRDEDIEGAIKEFDELLSEYRKESRLDNFPAEAEAYAELTIIQSKMARVRYARLLAGKNIVVVAGGFSSGKSSFINSLIGTESNLLPTRITPTTSIPTYVQHVPDTPLDISSFNKGGGKKQLDEPTLRAITHDFERKYGIALKEIVDRVVVSTPDLAAWNRLAFVDTPGYTNPEGDHGQRRDVELTLNEVLAAHYLVWLIDCERGTLLGGDVEYIKRFVKQRIGGDRGGKGDDRIYLVVSKADKIPRSQRSEILGQVSEVAANAGIPYAGVGMYSANEGEWFEVAGERFDAFLDGVNQRAPDLGVKADVQSVLDRYIEFHRSGVARCRVRVGLLKRLALLVDDGDRFERSLSKELTAAWDAAEDEARRHEAHATAYSSLHRRFTECLDRFEAPLGNRAAI